MNILRTILFSMVVAMAGAVHDARAQAPNDGEELGAVSSGSAHLAKDDSLADGLYMLGTWVANYTAGYSSISITLPFIHNVGNFTSGTLRLSFWATVTAPARGAGFTGYRLATFPTMAPLGSGLSYQNISQSTSMLVPPDGTYWLVLVLEEYYPSACPSSADGYCLADSTVSFSQRTFGSTSPDVVVSQALLTNPVSAGKDAIVDVTVTNTGPGTATGVTLTMTYEAFTSAIWASPGCVKQPSTSYVCAIGTMGSGATSRLRLVLRRSGAGTLTNSATVTSTTPDANTANNTSNISATVFPGTAGVPVLRYRLYSPVTLEHHFTTDANEYNVLGASGGWVKEGTVGKVLNNPGSFNGVAAIPLLPPLQRLQPLASLDHRRQRVLHARHVPRMERRRRRRLHPADRRERIDAALPAGLPQRDGAASLDDRRARVRDAHLALRMGRGRRIGVRRAVRRLHKQQAKSGPDLAFAFGADAARQCNFTI
jgi:hypothetical protein